VKLIGCILDDEPPPPHRLVPTVARDLETIILKASAKELERRYQQASELADDLRRFLANEPINARRVNWTERAWRWTRRNPALANLSALVALPVLAIAVIASASSAWLGI